MKKILHTAAMIVLFVITILMVLFAAVMLTKAEYVNAKSGLRIRKNPSTEADILGVLPYGTQVSGIRRSGWLKLDDREGYVFAEYLQADEPDREYLGRWRITAYAYTGSPCANGNYPTTGYTVACNSLPFGTQVYIDGVGIRTVEDNDGGRMGNEWLDLYLGSVTECIIWGDQYRDIWRVE